MMSRQVLPKKCLFQRPSRYHYW